MKFRIGPATMITLIIVAMIAGYSLYQQHRTNAQPPVIERQVSGATAAGIAPVPEFLLRHRAELALTAEQVAKLKGISAAFRKDIAPMQRQLTASAAAYRQYLDRTRTNNRPKAGEIESQSADIQRWSGVMATTRQAYWQQARDVLTATQRQRADALLAKVTVADLR